MTSDLAFEQYYGQKATKRRKLYNGTLRTDLFQYWGQKSLAIRLFKACKKQGYERQCFVYQGSIDR